MSMENLLNSFDKMSLESWDPLCWAAQACPVLSAPVDWRETSGAHILTVDLPGLTKEEVKVEVDQNGVLQISGDRGGGDRAAADKGKGERWHRVERSRGKFARRFALPENAKPDDVKASMEDGVLRVVVGKREVQAPERKLIQVEDKN